MPFTQGIEQTGVDMSPVTASDPPFGKIARHANKLMDQLQKGYYNFYPGEAWTPSANLYETETAYQVCVDLAGVDKEKIDIELIDGHLKIKGTRPVPTPDDATDAEPQRDPEAKKIRVHLMEIDHGAFAREVELPRDADRARITAAYRNGMLWVEIPKK